MIPKALIEAELLESIAEADRGELVDAEVVLRELSRSNSRHVILR